MTPHSETAAATGSIVATAGPVFSKGVAPSEYRFLQFDATVYAAAFVTRRSHVTPVRGRLVAELAQLGGGARD